MDDHRFEALDNLIGTTLGEDWQDEFDTPDEALEDRFRAGVASEMAEQVIADVDRLFAEVGSAEERLSQFLVYAFRQDPSRFDAWLSTVRERAVEALAGRPHEPLRAPLR